MENNFTITDNNFLTELTITDNFLTEQKFNIYRDQLFSIDFPWHFLEAVVDKDEDLTKSPGGFKHIIYMPFRPPSPFYGNLLPLITKCNPAAIYRINVNLLLRLPEPFYHQFHTDTEIDMEEDVASQWISSILYMNTNNGYTEFEDGTKVESVANRLVSFPSNTKHRTVTQTDEQRRIVINMVYLKRKPCD